MHARFGTVQQAHGFSQRFRRSGPAFAIRFCVACGLLLASFGIAAAQTAAPEPAPTGPQATVEGFRAAHFGMTEEQVRQAISRDFPKAAAKVKKTIHPTEKTIALSLQASDLLPSTGLAQISYILGYKSKQLIQINIVWRSDGSDDGDRTLVGMANMLRDYFAAQHYKPGTIVTNRRFNENTIIVFRAADARDKVVLVLLIGTAGAARKDQKQPAPPPLALEVSYVADIANPDVFRIGKGQF